MAANSAKKVRSSKRTVMVVSRASPAKGVACEISKRSERRNQCCTTQWAERVDIHTCEALSSGLWEASYWPKIVSEAISKPLNSKNYLGGHVLRPPTCSALTTNLTTLNLMATALPQYIDNLQDRKSGLVSTVRACVKFPW